VVETVAAVQELHKVITAQQEEIERLRGEIAAAGAQMAQFENVWQERDLILSANEKR
jgi:uncharacterized small protein (DUF1192 family)